MEAAIDIASWACLMAGSFFCLVGGIGINRLPDFYTRGHAAGVTDTLGAMLVLLGLMLQSGLSLNLFKLLMILAFMLITSPTSSHALAKAAWSNGLRPWMPDGADSPDSDGGAA